MSVRCCACRAEFTSEQIAGVNACPTCSNKSIPMDTTLDRTITINVHELRILTIWAGQWAAHKCGVDAQKTLNGILDALRVQLPGIGLTLKDDVQQVANIIGKEVEMYTDGKRETFKLKEPS